MAKLFEIKAEIEELLSNIVNEETGEIIGSELDLERLAKLDMERDNIRTYLCQMYRNELSDAEAYKGLKAEYTKKQKIAENRAQRLLDYLKADFDGEKWEAPDRSVKNSFRTTKNKVIVDDLAIIPADFFRRPIKEDNLMKTEIKEYILNGNKVDGVHLEDSVSMSIR